MERGHSSGFSKHLDEMLREMSGGKSEDSIDGDDLDEERRRSRGIMARVMHCRTALEIAEVVDEVVKEKDGCRVLLDALFHHVAKRGENGVRGIKAMIFAYEAVANRAARDHEIRAHVVDHIMWLSDGSNAYALLRLRNMKELSRQQFVIEKLASTHICRTAIQVGYVEGPMYIFYAEIFAYLWLGFVYTILTLSRLTRVRFCHGHLEKLWAILALPCLDYFSAKLDTTLRLWSDFERATDEFHRKRSETNFATETSAASGDSRWRRKASYARIPVSAALSAWHVATWLWHRMTLLVAAAFYGPIVYPLLRCVKGKESSNSVAKAFYEFFVSPPAVRIHRRSTCIPPRVWYTEALSYFEVIYLVAAWIAVAAALFRNQVWLRKSRRVEALLNLGIIMMWLRLLHFLRRFKYFAAFVHLVTNKIAGDLRSFLAVLAIFFAAFTHALYLAVSFSDGLVGYEEGDPRIFSDIFDTMYTLYVFCFTGEVDSDNITGVVNRLYLSAILFVMVVVMLNVLIAIVAESYEDAMTRGAEIFWRSRFEQVAETIALWGPRASLYPMSRAAVADMLDRHLSVDDIPIGEGASQRHQLARIIELLRDTRLDAIANLEEKVDTLTKQVNLLGDERKSREE